MFSKTWTLMTILFLITPAGAMAGAPAARLTDSGQPAFHAGSAIVGGSANVLINGLPASRIGDPTSCPQICSTPLLIPHSAGSITTGSTTVLINGIPAARLGDVIVEPATPSTCQASHSITTGSTSVLIGP